MRENNVQIPDMGSRLIVMDSWAYIGLLGEIDDETRACISSCFFLLLLLFYFSLFCFCVSKFFFNIAHMWTTCTDAWWWVVVALVIYIDRPKKVIFWPTSQRWTTLVFVALHHRVINLSNVYNTELDNNKSIGKPQKKKKKTITGKETIYEPHFHHHDVMPRNIIKPFPSNFPRSMM